MEIIRGRRIPTIRDQVARVLLASATLLSVLFGLATFLYETWRAVGRFEAMATVATSALTARLADQCQSRIAILDDATVASFLAERYQVPGGHFVAVRIVDDTGRVVAKASAHGFPALLDPHSPPVADLDHIPPRILVRNGELFVLIVREMAGVGETRPGRFQGVFHIEGETRDHVINAAMEAVALTSLTVLMTAGILYPIITQLHRDLVIRSDELMRSHTAILQALGSAIAKRDSDTHLHNFRVTFYSVRLAEAAARPPREIAALIKGAFLHDLGKIAISDTILLKQGRLTDEEMATMKSHVTHGMEMVAGVPWLTESRDVVGSHHERWDGTGYPAGLAGEAISMNARIFAIADVFDALTSRRPYKAPLPLDRVLGMLQSERGCHFDPRLLDIFLPMASRLFEAAHQHEVSMAETVFHLADTYLEI
ncbi:MAG: HD-GYP domain-containing protein [Magnetococcales bacterium]|nr:HD-GYP domain-containing protein [Magnetococcales bacterium]